MRKLRWLYFIDGTFLLIAGLLLGGWSNSPAGMDLLGMEYPGEYLEHLPEWRAVSFAGEFGGALMAFGFATLAIARSKDSGIHRSSIGYFLAAHFFLSFLVLAKQMAFGASPGGLMIFVIVLYPCAAFLYALLGGSSPLWTATAGISDDELRIRDAAGQEERTRLAKDLHDSVKQQVYAIQTGLATAQARLATDIAGTREAIDRARSSAHEAMAEMTALLDRLRRDPIEGVGLIEALRRQGEALRYQIGAEVNTRFNAMPSAGQLPAGAMTVLFRIAQEALANIARHARASHVQVQAGITPEPTTFLLTVHDDGQGFEPASTVAGMGLANIRDRAAEIGGCAEITSAPGEGCTMTVRVPLLDPRHERLWRHNLSVVVSMAILIPTGLLTWVWTEARPYLLPLAALSGLLLVFHATAAGTLRWRAR